MTIPRDELQTVNAAVAHRNAVNRRRFLTMAGTALAVSLGDEVLLSGCAAGNDTETPSQQFDSGTIKLGGYPDWIGNHELAGFASDHPGNRVQQVAINVDEDRIAKLATDPSAVDIMLLTEKDVQRVVDLGVAVDVDLDSVPNYANIDPAFKFGYAADSRARCVTTDYGKTGFAYRRDLVDETLTSWEDVWRVAPSYSGQITFLDFPAHVIGTGLILNGDSISSTDEATLEAAADRVIEIKPHLQSFVETNLSKGLLDGSVVIAMDWDYDVFLAQQKNDDIVWVAPEDGVQAYLDVWIPISTSDRLPVVWDFFNYHYVPQHYANFVNTLGCAFCMDEARPFIDDAIASSPILYPGKDVLGRLEYQKALGEGARLWDEQWQRIKAA